MRVVVACEVYDYSDPRKENLRIYSHFKTNKLVELEINGERYTVGGDELKTAIDNCMNTGF